jgi:hypothetical protein
MESWFQHDLGHVRVQTGRLANASAVSLNARAYVAGSHIVLRDGEYCPDRPSGWQLLGHEIAHVLQQRHSGALLPQPLQRDSDAEREAVRAASRIAQGLPVGPIRQFTPTMPACTPVSTAIEALISYSATDWAVTDTEEDRVIALFVGDATPSATIRDLSSSGMLDELAGRVATRRRSLVELLGGRCDAGSAALARTEIVALDAALSRPRGRAPAPPPPALHGNWTTLFDICQDLQNNLRRLGVSGGAPAFNATPYARLISSSGTAPFSGAGATGVNPHTLSIPLVDMARLAAGHGPTEARYSNPIPGSLPGYLATLSAPDRMDQATVLVSLPIVSAVPDSYAGNIPSRGQIMRAAAAAHNLHPALLAGFILAEQRDQSRNEDAKDLIAATSIMRGNTSIGLGQVVVSTAQRNDLFADLLSASVRGSLSHEQVAHLLASDEFNIMAVARYIRIVANRAAGMSIATLPSTRSAFPGISMGAYAANSSAWPADNIRALGSEYTSRPWDDSLSVGWADFVYEAYRNVQAAGVL